MSAASPSDSFKTRTTNGWHGGDMTRESRHIAQWIERPAAEVYAYAADPANLPAWAPGLGSSVENVTGQWFVETDMGRVEVAFAPANEFGILDHDVTLPSGEVVSNPVRVIADGTDCEVVFTLRRSPGMSDAEFERDAAAVSSDLRRLAQILEDRAQRPART
jgi:hypothetical protein